MLLLPILIEVAKKEGIEIKEIPKEALEKKGTNFKLML